MKQLFSFDWSILVCTLVLFGFSLATIASVAPEFLVGQVTFCIIGLVLFFIFSKIDYHIYASISGLIYMLSLILLGVTLFLGFESHGAVRWIALGPFRLQFSEFIKPFFAVVFANFLVVTPKKSLAKFFLLLLSLLIPTLIIFKQPDLGSSLVLFGGGLLMIFVSEVNLVYMVLAGIVSLVFAPIFWFVLAPYQKGRILTFLSPKTDPLGSSYNAIQAVITVGSGMFFGEGLGRGTQSHLLFLPEHHTDFIFASIAEELGFIGSLGLILVYFFLIWKIFAIAAGTADTQAKLICTGIGAFILLQTFINIGMNVGLLPVTGITLPLVSYGGSSLLATMIGLGIVANVSSFQKADKTLHIV